MDRYHLGRKRFTLNETLHLIHAERSVSLLMEEPHLPFETFQRQSNWSVWWAVGGSAYLVIDEYGKNSPPLRGCRRNRQTRACRKRHQHEQAGEGVHAMAYAA